MRLRSPDALTATAIGALAAAALAFNRSDADFAVTRLAYDAARATFPLRDHWLFARVLHDGVKWASVLLALGALCALAVAAARPSGGLRPYRGALAYLVAAALASAGLVALLRSFSAHSCPWDLAAFGGGFDFFAWLDPRPPHPGPGRCSPSGHAASGFAWIAAIYACHRVPRSAPVRPRAALVALPVVVFGALASATQVARGAHFVSHALLTAAICWAVAWIVFVATRS